MATQVQSDFVTSKFIMFITSDHELSTLTGIPNFCMLNTIEKLVQIIKKSSTLCTKLSLREIIIMTFMKLKQNSSYSMLAILFKCCTAQTCKERIYT